MLNIEDYYKSNFGWGWSQLFPYCNEIQNACHIATNILYHKRKRLQDKDELIETIYSK